MTVGVDTPSTSHRTKPSGEEGGRAKGSESVVISRKRAPARRLSCARGNVTGTKGMGYQARWRRARPWVGSERPRHPGFNPVGNSSQGGRGPSLVEPRIRDRLLLEDILLVTVRPAREALRRPPGGTSVLPPGLHRRGADTPSLRRHAVRGHPRAFSRDQAKLVATRIPSVDGTPILDVPDEHEQCGEGRARVNKPDGTRGKPGKVDPIDQIADSDQHEAGRTVRPQVPRLSCFEQLGHGTRHQERTPHASHNQLRRVQVHSSVPS
jgi:hypothetical protein